jgi:hypothetical protein
MESKHRRTIRISCRGLPCTAEAVSETSPAGCPYRRIPRYVSQGFRRLIQAPSPSAASEEASGFDGFRNCRFTPADAYRFPRAGFHLTDLSVCLASSGAACFQSVIRYFFNVPARQRDNFAKIIRFERDS